MPIVPYIGVVFSFVGLLWFDLYHYTAQICHVQIIESSG